MNWTGIQTEIKGERSWRSAIRPALLLLLFLAGLAAMTPGAMAAQVFSFNTPPFEGSTALETPGRQIVGGEPFISFNILEDVFSFDRIAFNLPETLNVFNGQAGNFTLTGVQVVVLQTTDNDNDAGTPFLAGTAANLIATMVEGPAPGFFIYHNSNLGLNRLVYSTDLSDPTADLKIIARMTNLSGQDAINALPSFNEGNFQSEVPEPATLSLLGGSLILLWLKRRKAVNS